MSKDWFYLPSQEYNPQFLKALAMASHCGVINPSELSYWFAKRWSQLEITVELYNRVKPIAKAKTTIFTPDGDEIDLD